MRIWLRNLRHQRGLTQEEVAVRANISRTYYVQLENQSGCPSLSPDTAKKIAKVLGFEWSIFFEEDSDRTIKISRCD